MATKTNRQWMSEWAARNREWPVDIEFEEYGPENDREYVCAYILPDDRKIHGEKRTSKAAAKESAATAAKPICMSWEAYVSPPPQRISVIF